MELTSENVEYLCLDCMGNETDQDVIEVNGILNIFKFSKTKLQVRKAEICEMLKQLDPRFFKETGGGWTFLQVPFDKNRNQWGEHRNAEQLVVLGIGIGIVSYAIHRSIWAVLPGGVPYIVIDMNKEGVS